MVCMKLILAPTLRVTSCLDLTRSYARSGVAVCAAFSVHFSAIPELLPILFGIGFTAETEPESGQPSPLYPIGSTETLIGNSNNYC